MVRPREISGQITLSGYTDTMSSTASITAELQPAIQQWFAQAIGTPSEMQQQAWQHIATGEHTLIAAPTGSGKTLAAFVPLFDKLLTPAGQQSDTTRVLYVSPLKSLSHDVERNLQPALDGISSQAGLTQSMRAAVRTGDTLTRERQKQLRKPPHILVTTPESLFILLCSQNGRKALSGIRQVVVDELHALAGNKRGAHFLLSLERLQRLVSRPLQRIGVSATQKPLSVLAEWLCGGQDCSIVDAGLRSDLDLDIELTPTPLSSLLSNLQMDEICARIKALAQARRTTLVFVNTRRMAERMARRLSELMESEGGKQRILATHHGSLSRELRLDAEQRLKTGQLQLVIATSSLELGIDIGSIDLVCQLGSPKRFSAMLQRAGRAGHHHGGVPMARLFPLTRDDLLESWVLLQGLCNQQLDSISLPSQPLDVLAQQIMAECACGEQTETGLAEWVRRAWPYRHLDDQTLSQVLTMLADGYSGRQEQLRLLWDRARGRLQADKNLRSLCAMNAGAIPDQFDQDVWLVPDSDTGHTGTSGDSMQHIGTVDEEFAFESLAGDVVQLGNRSLQIVKSSADGLFVQTADEHPPAIPFWFGEGAGRSVELSDAMAQLLNQTVDKTPEQLAQPGWLMHNAQLNPKAAEQLCAYLAACHAALDGLPHQNRIIIERFFDTTGNFHVVIHSTFGIGINRAWGLALRKRFCRQFNFELQAAASDNGLLLSLGPTHSFPLEDITGYLKSHNVREILIQALLDSPLFVSRWRWAANTALAVLRMRNGKKVAPQQQRNQAEDLLALLFPDQLACLENIRGEREIPDHPLVTQVINDCLFEAMDIEGLESVLIGIEQGDIQVSCLDLNGPSPLAEELINGKPWMFLDDGEAEERRTRTVETNYRTPDIATATSLRALPEADIQRLRKHCWPQVNNPESLHALLCKAGYLTIAEGQAGGPVGISNPQSAFWSKWFQALVRDWRAAVVMREGKPAYWVADLWGRQLLSLDDTLGVHQKWLENLPEIPIGQSAETTLTLARMSVLGPVDCEAIDEVVALPCNTASVVAALQTRGDIIQLQAEHNWWFLRQHAVVLRQGIGL